MPDDRLPEGADAAALYDLLEHEVAPRYYERDEAGIPRDWVASMKEAIISSAGPFSSDRMVAQYLEGYYIKANNGNTAPGA